MPDRTFDELPRAVVVLGAGASADAASNGQLIKDNGWRPPVARELFDFKHRAEFHHHLMAYRGAQALAGELASLSARGDLKLEDQLRSYEQHPDERVQRQYRGIPPYLRDVIATSVRSFVDFPGAYLQLLKGLLADHPHRVAFLTLNYDTYIERALGLFDPSLQVLGMDDYVRPDRQAIVAKVHGSIHWLAPFGNTSRSYEQCLDEVTLEEIRKSPVHLVDNLGSLAQVGIQDELGINRRAYPVLTAPLAGKGDADLVCPTSHLDALQAAIGDCLKFLFIGTSGLDDDVLTLLHDHVPASSLATFVSKGDVSDVMHRHRNAIPSFNGTVSRLYDDGFANFVESSEFLDFLRA